MICTTRQFAARFCATAILFAGPGLLPLAGANIATNGGFETGNLSGWATSADCSGTSAVSGTNPHGGSFGFSDTTPKGSICFLSQTITTVPGGTYEFGFFLAYTSNSNVAPSLSVTSDVDLLLALGGTTTFPYQEYSFTITPSTASTVISFSFAAPTESAWYLDDVTVSDSSRVPEPATAGTLGAGGVGLWLVRRRRRS